jgi:hypothetical protein
MGQVTRYGAPAMVIDLTTISIDMGAYSPPWLS